MSICGNNCEKCRYGSRCGGCSHCEAAVCKKRCNVCYAVCFKRKGTQQYMDSLGKLDIYVQSNRYLHELPLHIPILPDRLNKSIRPHFIAVHAGNMFSRNGESITPNYLKNGYSGALNIDNTSALLEFYVRDKTLEGFWDRRKQIYPDLKKMNFDYVIAPNFSVYEDAPRIDHLYNIKRSSIVYNELLEKGINAIPDVSWFNASDLEGWIEAINKNNIEIIAFSFQNVAVGMKTSNSWRNSLSGLRYLCENIKHEVKIILAGVVSPLRIAEIYRSIGKSNRLHILNQSAYVQSRRGMLSESREQCRDVSFDKLLEMNIRYFDCVYEALFYQTEIETITGLHRDELLPYYEELLKKPEVNELILGVMRRQMKKRKVRMGGETGA